MTTDELFCRWAERKYGVEDVERVEFVHKEGWSGTDVTPGTPDEVWVYVTANGRRVLVESEVEVIPALIREIAEFALSSS